MIKRYFFLLLFAMLLLFSSCKLISIISLVNKGDIVNKEYYRLIPFENSNNMILLKVKINGITYGFILDTGAFTVISERIADSLHSARLSGTKILDSQGNRQKITFTSLDSMMLEDLAYINTGVGIFNFEDNQELACFAFDGILGANLLRHSVCQVNLTTKTLILTNDIEKLQLPDNSIKIHFKQHITGQPLLKMNIEGYRINNVILDYGSGSGINIASGRLWRWLEKGKHPRLVYKGYSSIGLFGKKQDESRIFQSTKLSLQGMPLDTQLIILNKTGISTLGVQFLKDYQVTLDYPHQVIYLEKIEQEDTEEISTFGFTPVLSEGKLVISGLFERSPATAAGMKAGDQLLQVNEKDYSHISRDDYCDVLKNGLFPDDADSISVVFKSDTLIKTAQLKKMRYELR